MAKRGRTRKGSGGLISLIWSPFKHLFMASGESAQKLGSTAGKVIKESMKGVEGVGSSFSRHANQAIGGITRKVGSAGKSVGRSARKLAKSVTGRRRK